MDYILGFQDATEMVLHVVNKMIKKLRKSKPTEEDYEAAIDSFISLAYILQFQSVDMEDEYFESLIDMNCDCCVNHCEIADYNKDLEYDIDDFIEAIIDIQSIFEENKVNEGDDN